jgi:hypothetical protein
MFLQREEFPDRVETMIRYYYLIDFCSAPPVGTLLAYGEDVSIPNGDFTVDRRHGTARLQTTTSADIFGRVGAIDLTWKVNLISNESFAGRGKRIFLSGPGENEITRTTFKEEREDRSADVSGVAFEYSLSGLGAFGWTTITYTEK